MAVLPNATTTLVADAGARAAGLDTIIVIAAVPNAADGVARVYGNADAIYQKHGYAKGVDYAALHIQETGLPVVFCGIPIVTAGYVGQQRHDSAAGVLNATGSCLDDVEGIFEVTKGGTAGTDLIRGRLSLDGGQSWKSVNLGTATSYVVPYIGVTLTVTDDVEPEERLTFRGVGPLPDADGYELARLKLTEKQIQARSWFMADDVPNDTVAASVVTEANAYETVSKRFVYARCTIYDRPVARMSNAGEVVFAASTDTATRDAGSWIADGYRVGMTFTPDGTASNDAEHTITTLTATVLTVGASPGFVDETIDAADFTAEDEVSKADHVAEVDAEFDSIDSEARVDLAHGRGFKQSPFTGFRLRRSPAWGASVREYQHDPSIPTWRKKDGPLSGWSLENADGELVEHDERIDGGALAARFTCFRTWGNGPNGVFVAQSLTRADANSVLSQTHAMAVANIACTVTQQATELCVGEVLVLKADGTATADALGRIKARVDSALERALLRDFEDGPRASDAYYTPSADDDLSGPDAVLTGVVTLNLLGTIVEVDTQVRVNPNAA